MGWRCHRYWLARGFISSEFFPEFWIWSRYIFLKNIKIEITKKISRFAFEQLMVILTESITRNHEKFIHCARAILDFLNKFQ